MKMYMPLFMGDIDKYMRTTGIRQIFLLPWNAEATPSLQLSPQF